MGDVANTEVESHVLRTHITPLGKEIIFSEAEKNVPVIFGRNPATKDLKYASTKGSDEIHVKLVDEAGREITKISRRSLSMIYTDEGYVVENLTGSKLPFEIAPGSKRVLSPGEPVLIPAGDMRNFKSEISPGFLLETQAIGGGPLRVQTLLFTKGNI